MTVLGNIVRNKGIKEGKIIVGVMIFCCTVLRISACAQVQCKINEM